MIEEPWICEKACVKVYIWMRVARYLNYAGIHSARLLRHYSFPTSSDCFHRRRRRHTAGWTRRRKNENTYVRVYMHSLAHELVSRIPMPGERITGGGDTTRDSRAACVIFYIRSNVTIERIYIVYIMSALFFHAHSSAIELLVTTKQTREDSEMRTADKSVKLINNSLRYHHVYNC